MTGDTPENDNGGAPPAVTDDDDVFSGVVIDIEAAREVKEPPTTVETGGGITLKKRQSGGGEIELRDCPVIPLGLMEGLYYYLTERNELWVLAPSKHRRHDLMALFGRRQNWVWQHFDRPGSKGEPTGKLEEAALADSLMAACADRGLRDVRRYIRGPGCWLGPDFELIMHCGDTVFVGGSQLPPGLIGNYVYPAAPAGPRPDLEAQPDGPEGPGDRLLKIFQQWTWRRPNTDPTLLLGFVAAGIVGGALDWRPMVWVTGASATGKSTLFDDVLDHVFGGAVVHSTDPTAAGIHQKTGAASSLPIVIDEAERKEDNRRIQAVIELARQAASGGIVLRGSADHSAAAFNVRSCFAFSSISVPTLKPQDRNRIAVLELERFDRAAEPPAIGTDELSKIGAGLRRRLVDEWPRVQDRLRAWRRAMKDAGHGGRGADLYGTLLALADLVLTDYPPTADDLEPWQERLNAAALARRDDAEPEERECLIRMLSFQVGRYRGGEAKSMASWIKDAVVDARDGFNGFSDKDYTAHTDASAVLGNHGLRLHRAEDGSEWLVVANRHEGLNTVFAGTRWHAGGGGTGGWRQSLLRLLGARTDETKTFRFAGLKARGVLIPLDALDVDLPKRQ